MSEPKYIVGGASIGSFAPGSEVTAAELLPMHDDADRQKRINQLVRDGVLWPKAGPSRESIFARPAHGRGDQAYVERHGALPAAGPPPENESADAKAHREHHERHRQSHGDAMSIAPTRAAGEPRSPIVEIEVHQSSQAVAAAVAEAERTHAKFRFGDELEI